MLANPYMGQVSKINSHILRWTGHPDIYFAGQMRDRSTCSYPYYLRNLDTETGLYLEMQW